MPAEKGSAQESSARGTAVVNGAGPAGLIAAACLASRGFNVKIFDKGCLDPRQSNSRSFCFKLDGRTFSILQALQISCTELEEFELKELQIHPVKGITIPFPPSSATLTERHTMVTHLQSELKRLFKAQISIHLEHKLTASGIDLSSHRLTYVTDGKSVEVSYDMLIAADGVHSPIRAAMQQQVSGFVVHSDGSYEASCKTFLPADFKQTAPDAKCSIHLHELCDPASKRVKNEHSGALWTPEIPGLAPAEGHLFLHKEGLPNYTTQEDFQQLLSRCKLPQDIVDALAKQAADPKRWRSTISRLKCSQLHGPRVVILGEAAHTVTSHDGQGCNAGAEDVAVLGKVLDQEMDLDKVPAAFTEARLADTHALFELNRKSMVKAGFVGPWHWEFVKHLNNIVIWGALHRQLPFLVGPPLSPGSADAAGKPLSYSTIVSKCNERLYTTLLVAGLAAAGFITSFAKGIPALRG